MINLLICHDNYICNLQDMYDRVYAALKEELRERGVVIPDSYKIISDWEGAEVSFNMTFIIKEIFL